MSETPSLDKRLSAVTYQRSCGATTGFGTHVSILGVGERIADSGNVLIANGDHGAVKLTDLGAIPLSVKWTGAREITITIPSGARVFKRETHVAEVSVLYEEQKQ